MINIIAAMSENHVIANTKLDNKFKIPWHIPNDFKRFKELTIGHPVIMGRKTFDTLGKPLPERLNLIVSRDDNFQANNCYVFSSVEYAIEWAKTGDKKVFIIGGGQIYKEAMPLADKICLTIVEGQFEGDVFFPQYLEYGFKNEVVIGEGEQNGFKYKFLEITK